MDSDSSKIPPKLFRDIRGKVYDYVIKPLAGSRNSPHHDALGVSLGLIVGFGAPLGSHMLILGIARLIFKFNFMVAFGFTFVVNPFTVIPLYYGYYLLGSFLLGESPSLSFENFKSAMGPVMETDHFWETVLAFFHLGEMIVRRWLVAAAFVGVLTGGLGYVATYIVQKRRCFKSVVKLSEEYKKLASKSSVSNSQDDISA